MKIPRLFRLEKRIESVTGSLADDKRLNRLLISCEDFLIVSKDMSPDFKYNVGESFASKLIYFKEDVEELSKRLFLEDCKDNLEFYMKNKLGFYLSALINKIIKGRDEIVLAPKLVLEGIGAYLPRGTVIVRSRTDYWTGFGLAGGRLVVEGGSGNYTGDEMKDGLIIIQGDVMGLTGYKSEAGEIHVGGEIREGIPLSCKAVIYEKNKKVWPRV